MITSMFILGSWLGCILMSLFGMSQGRRVWIIVGNILEIIGTLISVTSYGPGQLIAGRVVIVGYAVYGNQTHWLNLQ